MTRRPPTDQALKKALRILLESSNFENPPTKGDNNESLTEAHNRRIEAYQILIDSTQAALGEELKKLHHQRNTLAPIHRLPLSIFTSILTFCIDEDPAANSTRPALLRQLASVSSHWLRTVKGTPTLWTVIDGSWDLPTIRLFLQKSQRNPLSIRRVTHGESGPKFQAFLAVILPHRARWQSVIFNSPRVETLEVPACILRSIQITRPLSGRSIPLAVTLASSKPLPAIKLQNQSFTWTGLMAGLRTLRLKGLSDQVPSCKQVMEAIAQSRQLETICLSGWATADGVLDRKREKIHLPSLLDLRCSCVPASIQYAIIRRVEAPNCRSIVFCFEGVLKLELLRQVTNSIADRIKSLIATQNTAHIEIGEFRIRLTSPYTWGAIEEGVEICIDNPEYQQDAPLLGWISDKVPWQADVTIEQDVNISTEAMQHLSGASGLISWLGCFEVIAKPMVSNSGVTWLLPNLTELDLYHEHPGVWEFEEFVWDRWGKCDEANAEFDARLGVIVRPRPLETLKLPDGFAPQVSKAANHALGRCGCRE